MRLLARILPWVLALLLAAWSSQGIWPRAPVEGDEQGVLFGVAGMAGRDATLLHMRYTYELQPLYYQLLAGLVRVTGAAPDLLFALTTALGAAGFALAGARLLQVLLEWPLGWALVALLWCQEVTTAAYYMNTSALGGCVAMIALLVFLDARRLSWLWAGMLLGVAGGLRADSLLIAPACLGLAYWQEGNWRPAVTRTTGAALAAIVVFLGIYALAGAALSDSLQVYGERGFMQSSWRTLMETIPQMLSPALALALLPGLGLLLAPGGRRFGVVVICGVTASLLAHGSLLTTPKYFYHMIPFLALPALLVVDRLVRLGLTGTRGARRAAGIVCAMVLVFADGFLGLRTLTEAQRFFRPEPTLATLFETTWRGKPIALVVGPGEVIFNADAFRLRTGKFFAPLCWSREKHRVNTDLATVRSWLKEDRALTLYWANWLPLQLAQRELLAAGFRPLGQPTSHPTYRWDGTRWQRGQQVAHLVYLGYSGSSFQKPGPAPASLTGVDTYFLGDTPPAPLTELADGRQWRLLSDSREGLITLYQRQ